VIGFVHLVALPLDDGGHVVADAIDGKTHDVGSADKTRKKRPIVFDPAIVVKKLPVRAFDKGLQFGDLIGAAPDIQDRGAGEIVAAPATVQVRLDQFVDLIREAVVFAL
jgi:hypothetical protein